MHFASLFPLIYAIRSSFPHISACTGGIWVGQIICWSHFSISMLEMGAFMSSEERGIIKCCHITIHVSGQCDGCLGLRGGEEGGALVKEWAGTGFGLTRRLVKRDPVRRAVEKVGQWWWKHGHSDSPFVECFVTLKTMVKLGCSSA